MRAAIVTFDGFDEIDTFVALGVLNHLRAQGWSAEIASPSAQVTSMNGVTVHAQRPLEFANEADVVVFGSGIYTRAIAEDGALLDRLTLDPLRQTIGANAPLRQEPGLSVARHTPKPPGARHHSAGIARGGRRQSMNGATTASTRSTQAVFWPTGAT